MTLANIGMALLAGTCIFGLVFPYFDRRRLEAQGKIRPNRTFRDLFKIRDAM